jgi:hypothetical protein
VNVASRNHAANGSAAYRGEQGAGWRAIAHKVRAPLAVYWLAVQVDQRLHTCGVAAAFVEGTAKGDTDAGHYGRINSTWYDSSVTVSAADASCPEITIVVAADVSTLAVVIAPVLKLNVLNVPLVCPTCEDCEFLFWIMHKF